MEHFDFSDLYNLFFGGRGIPFFINPAKLPSFASVNSSGITIPGKVPSVEFSKEGVEFYDNIDGNNIFLPLYIDNELMPLCTVEASFNKQIVKTPLVGKNGSVKELIRCEDIEFTVRGLCIGYDGNYPEEQLEKIIALSKREEALEVRHVLISKYFDGKAYCVVESLSLPEVKGVNSVRGFELKLCSDTQIELE